MQVGIMQPYFMPYIGYFQLMALVDKYVIFDDVNYIKRGWSSRNNLIINGQKHLFNISVEGGSQNNLYTEVIVSDDFVKLKKTLQMSYKKAPYYAETMDVLDRIFSYEDRRFNYFIKHNYEVLLNYWGVKTELILSSSLNNDKLLKGQDKIIDICKLLGAERYVNAIGGRNLYNRQKFKDNGIILNFLDPRLEEYPQFSSIFIPALSIIDAMMMNSKQQIKMMLKAYQLM